MASEESRLDSTADRDVASAGEGPQPLPGPLALLTGRGPEHRYVTARIAERFPTALKAVVLADPPPAPVGKRLAKWRRRYSTVEIASRVAAKIYRRALALDREFEMDVTKQLDPPETIERIVPSAVLHTVPSHNGPECAALLDEIQPDLLLIYGTDLIREAILAKGRLGTVNLHTGVSPRYRGADSVFWALHNGEPEWVGATVHFADPGLDSGAILATGRTGFEPHDREGTLFGKAVRVGSELLLGEIAKVLAGTASPIPQDHAAGHEYRFVDRTVRAERRVRMALRSGLLSARDGGPIDRPTADVPRA